MDEIIGLLFLVLPVIFGLVGKKLENAGDEGKSKPKPIRPTGPEDSVEPIDPMKKLAELFGVEQPEDVQDPEPELESEPELEPEPVVVETKLEQVYQARPVMKPVYTFEHKEEPRKRESIDPKKLVIYSEIMKPKFKE